jgi:hypothetical protein
MTEISSAKRAIIMKYRFYDYLTFQDISSRLTDVSAEAAKMICFRAQISHHLDVTTRELKL